jgi:type IV pilus assembly protein PilB
MALNTNLNEQLLKIRKEAQEREAKQKAEKTGLHYLDITSAPVKIDALQFIPEERARKLNAAAFEFKKPILAIAVLEPKDPEIIKLVEEFKTQGINIQLFVTSRRGLEHIWSFYRFSQKPKSPITSRVNIEKQRILDLVKALKTIQAVEKTISQFDFSKSSVTEFLEIVLSGALSNEASDIHFEPEENEVKLRYRIDGILHDISEKIPPVFYPSIISRIKLLSNLKINVTNHPQDGRFTIGLADKDIEIRVVVAPAEFGEIIVMRVLDPDIISLSLPELGLRNDDLDIIETELLRPNGMILNTGPTGSGKTSTLYAFLRAKHNPEIKIITIEDPVEYHLEGIEQTQVDESANYTFANGLKSIMRQDPDIILIGEIRDKETGEIGIQAALTGHLVFSTIHANEAAGAVPRLLDLGVKPTSIGTALNLIIAQRLVRRLCEKCKKKVSATKEQDVFLRNFFSTLPKRVDRKPHEHISIFQPVGCGACNNSGYKGRIGIFELLLNDPEYAKVRTKEIPGGNSSEAGFEDLIERQVGETKFKKYAIEHDMVTMQEDGILKVIQGITTFAEVEEVTGPLSKQKAQAH